MLDILLMGVAFVAGIMALQAGVRRLPISRHFRKMNDIVGFYVNLVGVIYAVVMTFMMVAVWEDFEDAARMVEAEASALKSIYFLAEGLPAPVCEPLQRIVIEYGEKTVAVDWPMMEQEKRPTGSDAAAFALWRILTAYEPKNAREEIALDHLIDRRLVLLEQRQNRLREATQRLPSILWMVLLYGGVTTIGLCFLFGVEQTGLHQFKTAVTASFIFLILLATWELDRPFTRNVRVGPEPFQSALERLREAAPPNQSYHSAKKESRPTLSAHRN